MSIFVIGLLERIIAIPSMCKVSLFLLVSTGEQTDLCFNWWENLNKDFLLIMNNNRLIVYLILQVFCTYMHAIKDQRPPVFISMF